MFSSLSVENLHKKLISQSRSGNKQNDYLPYEVTQGHRCGSTFHSSMKESSTHTATKALSYQSSKQSRENPKTNDRECEINGKFIGEKREKKIKSGREFYIQISQHNRNNSDSKQVNNKCEINISFDGEFCSRHQRFVVFVSFMT